MRRREVVVCGQQSLPPLALEGRGSAYQPGAGFRLRPAHAATFRRLRALLAAAGWAAAHGLTDAWWAYLDELDPAERTARNIFLQALERK
jgi:hypothetical protein